LLLGFLFRSPALSFKSAAQVFRYVFDERGGMHIEDPAVEDPAGYVGED
jgi:hypothetical protein